MKNVELPEALIDYQALAKRLGLPVGTLHSWVSRKTIPHYRFGPRLVRFDLDEIQDWLCQRYVSPSVEGDAPQGPPDDPTRAGLRIQADSKH